MPKAPMAALAVGVATCAAGFPFFACCVARCALIFENANQPPTPSPAKTTTHAVMTKTFRSAFDLGFGGGAPEGSDAPAKRRPEAGTVVLCRVLKDGGATGGGGGGGAS